MDEEKNKVLSFNKTSKKLLARAYELNYSPVGIKFIQSGQECFNLQQAKRKNTVCAFLKMAAQGECFYIDKDCISCPGGLKWMGFPSKLTDTVFYKFFLGKIEKVKSSPEIAEKFIDFLPKPPKEGLYEKILFAPLEKCKFEPDVVVIITNPKHAYRIIVAAYLDEYHLVKTIPICAACHGVISIPFVLDELNVSMIDSVAREFGEYNDKDILVGIPNTRFNSFIDNLKETPFGLRKEPFVAKAIMKTIDLLSEN